MLRKRLIATLVTLVCAALCAADSWRPGDGIQTVLTADAWPETLKALQSAKVDKKPYHFYKRDRAYDHQITVLTPFAMAAAYVQGHEGTPEALTYEAVSGSFDAARLTVRIRTATRNREKSERVLLALKTDKGLVEPYQESIESTTMEKVGFYAEGFYFVQKSFCFDISRLEGTGSLAVVIMEDAGKTLEESLDLAVLR